MRDLKADLELCNKATPGPWYREKTGENFQGFSLEQVIASTSNFATGNKVYATPKSGSFPANDADFISQAREGWPHAIERALKAEALVRELVEVLELFETVHIDTSLKDRIEDAKKAQEVLVRARKELGNHGTR